jgi:hypothetical protein
MDFSFLMGLDATQWAYLLIVVFLFVLAVIDLWVGVSNDAVNFLGSAVGSKAAKVKHVMIVAAVGVFVGAAFSNGMMEVARNGIFNPGEFAFNEVMIIFLAVMVSDVFLLDLFNSFSGSASVSERAKALKHSLASLRKEHIMRIHGKQGSLRVELVYLNLIQESHELLSEVRNLLRGCNKYYL